MHIFRLLPILIIALLTGVRAAADSPEASVPTDDERANIVIKQLTYRIRLNADKNSPYGVSRAEESTDYIFDARRVAGVALATAPYSDIFKITGTSGGKAIYIANYEDGIFYDDSHICIVPVEIKTPGKPVKASIRGESNSPEIYTGVNCAEPYDIEKAHYEIVFPLSLDGRYTVRLINAPEGSELTRTVKGNDVIYSVDFTDLKRVRRFADGPSPLLSVPRLEFDGFFADIDELYRYYYKYITNPDPNPETVEILARSITEGCSSDSARIAAITDYVHNNIRYIAVENGELGHRPDDASAVLAKKYGDCKGSANLLKAMLRANGFDARLVWIGGKSIPTDFSNRLALCNSNHMIAAVMLPGDSVLLIDGTSTYAPAGYVSPNLQGRSCLIEDTPESGIVYRVPENPADFTRRISDIHFTLTSDGTATASGTVTLTGTYNIMLAGTDAISIPNRRPDLYFNLFSKLIPKSKLTGQATANIGSRQSTISCSVTTGGMLTTSGSEAYLDLNPFPEVRGLMFETDNRSVDGDLGFTRTYSYTYTCILPDGWSVAELPEDFALDTPWLTASLTNAYDAATRTITRTITTVFAGTDVPVAELTAFNAKINRLARACNAKTILSIP